MVRELIGWARSDVYSTAPMRDDDVDDRPRREGGEATRARAAACI